MNILKSFLPVLILGAWTVLGATEPTATPGADKATMVTEMQAVVNGTAIKYGNIPFTQIFTNEPQRAAAVRKRFMEFERMDTLQKQIDGMDARAKELKETIQTNEAVAADLERKIISRKVELASLGVAPEGVASK